MHSTVSRRKLGLRSRPGCRSVGLARWERRQTQFHRVVRLGKVGLAISPISPGSTGSSTTDSRCQRGSSLNCVHFFADTQLHFAVAHCSCHRRVEAGSRKTFRVGSIVLAISAHPSQPRVHRSGATAWGQGNSPGGHTLVGSRTSKVHYFGISAKCHFCLYTDGVLCCSWRSVRTTSLSLLRHFPVSVQTRCVAVARTDVSEKLCQKDVAPLLRCPAVPNQDTVEVARAASLD